MATRFAIHHIPTGWHLGRWPSLSAGIPSFSAVEDAVSARTREQAEAERQGLDAPGEYEVVELAFPSIFDDPHEGVALPDLGNPTP